ncbi:MAG: response regulator [Fibrobacterales bacterium]
MSYTILIVDDSNTIRGALERTLSMTKLPIEEIIQAEDGVLALEKLKTNFVDIVLTDINMPNMNGVELVQYMKSHNEYKDIPIIVISTEGSKTRMEELKEMGISGYLRKPSRPEKLRDTLLEILGGWDEE